jgi:hypothetical protein
MQRNYIHTIKLVQIHGFTNHDILHEVIVSNHNRYFKTITPSSNSLFQTMKVKHKSWFPNHEHGMRTLSAQSNNKRCGESPGEPTCAERGCPCHLAFVPAQALAVPSKLSPFTMSCSFCNSIFASFTMPNRKSSIKWVRIVHLWGSMVV